MPDAKISALTSLASADAAADDVLVIVDTGAGVTKKIRADDALDALARVHGTSAVTFYFGGVSAVYIDNHSAGGGRIAARTGAGNEVLTVDAGDTPPSYQLSSGGAILWSNNAGASWQTKDTGMSRAAAGVVSITNGSTGGGTIRSIPSTPAQITGNQNDYAHGNARILRLDVDANRTITGFAEGKDGQEMRVQNINTGGFRITVANNSASSAASNRVLTSTGANVDVLAGTWMDLWYDGTTGRWRSKY